ncbi:hypothetical protein [Aureliella helgolandensis]|uniref:hypothetical protein n=1 Tax=Aureliella helgolandensis TaxID=2527968 RepID=UPI0011AA7C0F|nr:hypothetical protein [Aureliella helgolandensis]
MLLGAEDIYGIPSVRAYQIAPDQSHWTSDIPNLAIPWSLRTETLCRWLKDRWDLPFSEESIAITNLDALAGYCITEAVRWGNSEWELFSGGGDEVAESEARKIPLATLFAFDSSLQPVTELQVGEGGWREDIGSELQRWTHGES